MEKTETLKAWAAGVFDGEGDIELKLSGKDRSQVQIWVGVTNGDGRIIDTIYDNWGGYMHTKNPEYLAEYGKHDGSYRTSYTLYFSDKYEIIELLSDIKPYLISKRDAADIVLRAALALPDIPEGKVKRPRGTSDILRPFYNQFTKLPRTLPAKTDPRRVY